MSITTVSDLVVVLCWGVVEVEVFEKDAEDDCSTILGILWL